MLKNKIHVVVNEEVENSSKQGVKIIKKFRRDPTMNWSEIEGIDFEFAI